MTPMRLRAKGLPRRVQDAGDGGGDRVRSTLRVNSSQAETSPIGLPAAWQTRRQGEGARGGYVWFGVWFPLLCLANSLE